MRFRANSPVEDIAFVLERNRWQIGVVPVIQFQCPAGSKVIRWNYCTRMYARGESLGTRLVTFHSAESAHMSIQFAHARNVFLHHRKSIVWCTSQASGKLEASGTIKKVPHSDCAAPIVPVPKVVTIRSQSIKNWLLINTRSQNLKTFLRRCLEPRNFQT